MSSAVASTRRRRGGSHRLAGLGAYLRRRLIASVMTLLVSTFLVFSSLYLAGDPITALSRGRTIAPEMETALREQYRLDDPFFLRYIAWLGDLLRGDLGNSLMYSDQVTNVIGQRMGVTFELSVYAAAIIAVIGVGSGIIAGLRRGFADTAILTSTTVLMAVPPFVTAIVLLGVFSVALGWFPTRGAGDGYPERIWYLTLPAVALAVASLSVVSRVTRTSVRQEMGREHVQTAVSRGIPPGPTTRRHVIRNAMIPVTTVMGLTIASLIALTAIVEQAFGINGLGSALVQAASYNDFPVVQGIAVIYVLIFVVINTIIDVSYGLLDPRVRFGGGA